MKVSAVIATKNEEKHLENCLNSIKKQNFSGEIEIIVVDNNSQDRTREIAKKYADLVFDIGPERSVQRNFGVAKSTSEYFIFLDADMILSKRVFEQCAEEVKKNHELIGLYIPEIIVGKSYFNKIRNFERSFYNETVIDAPRFIKKIAFEKIGGFDEQLYACEDWDLAKRLKSEGAFSSVDSPIYHNETGLTFKKYLQKKLYYSRNFDKYFQKWGKEDSDIKKQFGLYYRFFGVFMENGKWKRFFSRPDLAAGIFWTKVLIGFIYLLKKNGKNS